MESDLPPSVAYDPETSAPEQMHTRVSPDLLNHRLGGFQPSVFPLKVSFPHGEGACTRASCQHATVSPPLDPSIPPLFLVAAHGEVKALAVTAAACRLEIVQSMEIGWGDFRG